MIDSKNLISKALNYSFILIEGNQEKNYEDTKFCVRDKFSIDNFDTNIDIRTYTGDIIDVELTKKIISEIGLKPFGNKKIIIINNFQLLKELCQNMLLKCLEELPKDTLVIGIAKDTIGILDTIKSRAYNVFIGDFNRETDEKKTLVDFNNREIINILTSKVDEEQLNTLLNNTLLKIEDNIKSNSSINIGKNLRVNELSDQCYKRIVGNCNKSLSYDLLLFRILEEK